jgi:hypothetical protein
LRRSSQVVQYLHDSDYKIYDSSASTGKLVASDLKTHSENIVAIRG